MLATVSENRQTYRAESFALWNVFAVGYTIWGYVGGIILLCASPFWLNVLGVVLLTHSLVCSAYLAHDCMHFTLVKSHQLNRIWGRVMLWINGGCYYGFDRLARQHIAHHVQRVDVFTFDIVAAIQKQPKLIRQCILLLEWGYFPIVAFWARWRSLIVVMRSTEQENQAYHLLALLLIRGILFILLGFYSWKALLLYGLSYIGMITILRWMDAFQHTYEAVPTGTKLPKRSYEYEQENTFTNLLSQKQIWLNFFLLNFGYHNAHHALMTCPWYRLPDLDQQLPKAEQTHYISLAQQIKSYHQFRIIRLLKGQGELVQKNGQRSFEEFYGANDVSFLTLY